MARIQAPYWGRKKILNESLLPPVKSSIFFFFDWAWALGMGYNRFLLTLNLLFVVEESIINLDHGKLASSSSLDRWTRLDELDSRVWTKLSLKNSELDFGHT